MSKAWISGGCAMIVALLLGLAPALAVTPPPPAATEWQGYTRRYLAPEGRVIDTANRGISHSEGQGYAMLFAVYFDDRPRFDLMWNWTRRHLSRSGDGLHAWRFDPNSNPRVADTNNATDGDIFIAWALLMAAQRWQASEYRVAAERIAADILRCCVTEFRGRTILLPGRSGFQDSQGVIVNLSYYAFPALRALSRVAPDPRWAALEADGLALMNEAAFGRWRLPPDWLLLPSHGGPPIPASRWPSRFSWDAVRIPLNLAWQNLNGLPLPSAHAFWEFPGHTLRPPAWVDLNTGASPSYPGHAGLRAVHALVRNHLGGTYGASLGVADAPDYYGASLVLQARLAPHLPVEPPALVPSTSAAAPSRVERALDTAQSAWSRLTGAGQEVPARPEPVVRAEPAVRPAPGQWARPDIAEPAQVRGMTSGYRGLVPPR